ncbi:MAG: hypothetical protein ABIQ29_04640 [Burkholderiaceae bacterium]
MKRTVVLCLSLLAAASAMAKLPAPVLTDEAKAKAAEAAAKTAHGTKVADFQLCRSMDKVAVRYQAEAKSASKELKPPIATPPCVDPGPFVYTPPAPVAAGPTAAATPATAAPAAAAASSAKPAAGKG